MRSDFHGNKASGKKPAQGFRGIRSCAAKRVSLSDGTLVLRHYYSGVLVTQLACAGVLCLICAVWIYLTTDDANLAASLTFVVSTFSGLILCGWFAVRIGDPRLSILGYLWLIKIGLTIVLLYFGWIPQLDYRTSVVWGYDPQRYYQDAIDLIHNGWRPTVGSNYQGIIYYYGAMFFLLGHNPIIPAAVNTFVTLVGSLFVIRVAYEAKAIRGRDDWVLSLLLLAPELLWFDVMTSRETLLATLIAVAGLAVGRYLCRLGKHSFGGTSMAVSVCLGGILAVRTSIAIAIVSFVALICVLPFLNQRVTFVRKLVISSACMLLFLLGPKIQQISGGYDYNYANALRRAQSLHENVASETGDWSDRSVGRLVAPHSAVQSVLYLPARMILYLIAPLPSNHVTWGGLKSGSYAAWQNLMTMASSAINIAIMPLILAGIAISVRLRWNRPGLLMINLLFIIVFAAVAGGNIIIHERYRVMASPLLFASAWIGLTVAPRRDIRKWTIIWGAILISGASVIFLYKYV